MYSLFRLVGIQKKKFVEHCAVKERVVKETYTAVYNCFVLLLQYTNCENAVVIMN